MSETWLAMVLHQDWEGTRKLFSLQGMVGSWAFGAEQTPTAILCPPLAPFDRIQQAPATNQKGDCGVISFEL